MSRIPRNYILKRVLYLIVVIWVAATVNFIIPRLAAKDPVLEYFAEFSGATGRRGEWVAAMSEWYRAWSGMNQPLWQQYVLYLEHMVRFDFGRSIRSFRPVLEIVGYALPWTVGLLGVTTVLGFIFGTVLGALSAWPRSARVFNFFAPLLMVLSVLPPFILALVLLDVLAFRLHLFPISSGAYTPGIAVDWGSTEFWLDVLRHAALPALSLFLVLVGTYAMGMRGMLVTVLGEDFITFADAKGLRKMRLFLNYVLRNVMLPQATSFAMSLGTVVTGATLVEAMFGYPGLGSVLEDAIRGFDYNLIQGCVFFLIIGIALATFVLDLIYPLLDPRIRYGKV